MEQELRWNVKEHWSRLRGRLFHILYMRSSAPLFNSGSKRERCVEADRRGVRTFTADADAWTHSDPSDSMLPPVASCERAGIRSEQSFLSSASRVWATFTTNAAAALEVKGATGRGIAREPVVETVPSELSPGALLAASFAPLTTRSDMPQDDSAASSHSGSHKRFGRTWLLEQGGGSPSTSRQPSISAAPSLGLQEEIMA